MQDLHRLPAPTGNLGFNCQPAIVRLTEDERGVLMVK